MNASRRKFIKVLSLCAAFVALISLISPQQAAYAEKIDEPKVLVIYTTIEGEIDDNLRNLDMLIGHFAKDISFISSDAVDKEDLKDVTHLFYFGEIDVQLPTAKFLNLFNDFSGQFVAIGYNSEQLSGKFSFVNQSYEAEINLLYPVDKKQKMLDIKSQNILGIEPSEGTKVLLEGKQVELNHSYPIMVQNENQYYYAFDGLYLENSIPFGDILYQVFQSTPSESHPGYIRLEDVHPLVDPKPLKEIAQILKEKDIPYMVAVIPTYTNPETGKESKFSDSPELLKVLKQIQEDGGSIILHGYTHQFRRSETGEGFEFWDVENNTPIYSAADKKFQMRKENDFASKEDYFSYLNELQKFETKYVETKVSKGIEELSQYGLYPIAFEAPHYTMSQNGYKIVSKYFSTYVGQVQLSDKDWRIMNTTPYLSSPSFLNGMQLLPETMGFYQPNDPLTIQEMVNKAAMMGTTEEGLYAAFYHPYLGVNGFKKVLYEMEKIPDISWIDLKQMDNRVKTENIEIHTENGEIIFTRNHGGSLWPSMDVAAMYVKDIIDKLVWGMVIIGAAAVMMFIIFTVYINGRKKHIEG